MEVKLIFLSYLNLQNTLLIKYIADKKNTLSRSFEYAISILRISTIGYYMMACCMIVIRLVQAWNDCRMHAYSRQRPHVIICQTILSTKRKMIFYIRPLEEFLAENYVCIWLNIIYSENGYLSNKKINSFKKEFEFKCKITFDWFVIGNEIYIY